jgi:hypothetical protein
MLTKKDTFGRQFRAKVTCAILSYVFKNDEIFLEKDNTSSNLTVLSLITVGTEVIMNKVHTAIQDMYVQHNAYLHTPIQNQSDHPQHQTMMKIWKS